MLAIRVSVAVLLLLYRAYAGNLRLVRAGLEPALLLDPCSAPSPCPGLPSEIGESYNAAGFRQRSYNRFPLGPLGSSLSEPGLLSRSCFVPTKWYQRTSENWADSAQRRRFPWVRLIATLLLLLTILGARWWLRALAHILIVDQAPVPADAIMVLREATALARTTPSRSTRRAMRQ